MKKIDAKILLTDDEHDGGACCACCDDYCSLSETSVKPWGRLFRATHEDGTAYISSPYIMLRADVWESLPSADDAPWVDLPNLFAWPADARLGKRVTRLTSKWLDRFDRAGLEVYAIEGEKIRVCVLLDGAPIGWATAPKPGAEHVVDLTDLPLVRAINEATGCGLDAAGVAINLTRKAQGLCDAVATPLRPEYCDEGDAS